MIEAADYSTGLEVQLYFLFGWLQTVCSIYPYAFFFFFHMSLIPSLVLTEYSWRKDNLVEILWLIISLVLLFIYFYIKMLIRNRFFLALCEMEKEKKKVFIICYTQHISKHCKNFIYSKYYKHSNPVICFKVSSCLWNCKASKK